MSTHATGYWATDRDDKEALLIASWTAGHSAREIAQALKERFGGNVTQQAVLGKAGRLALPLRLTRNCAGMSPDRRRKA